MEDHCQVPQRKPSSKTFTLNGAIFEPDRERIEALEGTMAMRGKRSKHKQ